MTAVLEDLDRRRALPEPFEDRGEEVLRHRVVGLLGDDFLEQPARMGELPRLAVHEPGVGARIEVDVGARRDRKQDAERLGELFLGRVGGAEVVAGALEVRAIAQEVGELLGRELEALRVEEEETEAQPRERAHGANVGQLVGVEAGEDEVVLRERELDELEEHFGIAGADLVRFLVSPDRLRPLPMALVERGELERRAEHPGRLLEGAPVELFGARHIAFRRMVRREAVEADERGRHLCDQALVGADRAGAVLAREVHVGETEVGLLVRRPETHRALERLFRRRKGAEPTPDAADHDVRFGLLGIDLDRPRAGGERVVPAWARSPRRLRRPVCLGPGRRARLPSLRTARPRADRRPD